MRSLSYPEIAYLLVTRMHSRRMRTVRCSVHLSCHAHPLPHIPLCNACPLPLLCTPATMHAPTMNTPATHGPVMHAPCHACPTLPCMPPTMHPLQHTCPPPHMLPPHPYHTHTPLWTEFLTHACENITFPQPFRTLCLCTEIVKPQSRSQFHE